MTRHWRLDARCAGRDPEMFFPTGTVSARMAKRFCAGCPVTDRCLDFALSNNLVYFGIFGATTPKERRALRRRWLREMVRAS